MRRPRNIARVIQKCLLVTPLAGCLGSSSSAGGVPCTRGDRPIQQDPAPILARYGFADGGAIVNADGGRATQLTGAECAWVCSGLDAGSTNLDCPLTKADGSIVVSCEYNCRNYISGRRPAGLHAPGDVACGDPLGAYWAHTAFLEWASVPAFERLATELAHHGAPAELVRRARVAAEDERRHGAMATREAWRWGATVQVPSVVTGDVRSLEGVALENLLEGCLNETLGAAVVAWQAQHAASARVRDLLAQVAAEEAQHAQLSWDVHAWVMDVLPQEGRQVLLGAFRVGARDLAAGPHAEEAPTVRDHTGYPTASVRHAMAHRLTGALLGAA